MALPPPGRHGRGKICKKIQISKIFSIATHMEKNFMRDYDVLENLYQNCKIHRPWVRGSGQSLSRYGHIGEMF